MKLPPASLYTALPADAAKKIATSITRGCARAEAPPLLFFRADDIGVPSASFGRMIEAFQRHRLPLCLATVPSWLTARRWQLLAQVTHAASDQWYWHQHGRRHRNYEDHGKKQEFGPARGREVISSELRHGRDRLRRLQGKVFQPVFTPPWNRCSAETLAALVELGFVAVSRSRGAQPEAPAGLVELAVNVDLHTRKETEPETGLTALLNELELGLASGRAGIMLHHQRMNRAALDLLDLLLTEIHRQCQITTVHFADLL